MKRLFVYSAYFVVAFLCSIVLYYFTGVYGNVTHLPLWLGMVVNYELYSAYHKIDRVKTKG